MLRHRVTSLMKVLGTGAAHVQIITDQEAAIAHQPAAEGTPVEPMGGLNDGPLPLAEGAEHNLLCFRGGWNPRLGKPNRGALPYRPALHTGQRKPKLPLVGIVLQIPGNDPLHSLAHLPKVFISEFFIQFITGIPF